MNESDKEFERSKRIERTEQAHRKNGANDGFPRWERMVSCRLLKRSHGGNVARSAVFQNKYHNVTHIYPLEQESWKYNLFMRYV